jgi:hypothetical protein
MATFITQHGLALAEAIAGALLYRVVAFWLPVGVSLVVLLQLRAAARDPEADKKSAAVVRSEEIQGITAAERPPRSTSWLCAEGVARLTATGCLFRRFHAGDTGNV